MADYSRDELMQALRAADAAGDAQAATAIARRIDSMRSPSFGNVQSSVRSTEAPRQRAPKRTAAQLTGITDEQMNPAYQEPVGFGTRVLRNVMPLADPNFRAGVGKSLSDSYQGLKQLGTEAGMVQTGLRAGLLNRLGLDGNALIRTVGFDQQDTRNKQMQDAAQTRENDAPLMGTASGLLGNVTGTAAQFLGPGMALRGTAAARAFLPATIAGNAAQGGVVGALQPFTDQGDRVKNAALGTAFGTAGAALPAVIGAGWRAATRPATTGAERRAGTVFKDALQGENLNYVSSEVPGVARSLGEGTLNPQIMAIERNARRDFPGMFEPSDLANNAARTGLLQDIAGNEQTMADALQSRSDVTRQLREQAFSEAMPAPPRAGFVGQMGGAMFGPQAGPVFTASAGMKQTSGIKAGIRGQIDAIAQAQGGRGAVKDTLNYLARQVDDAPDTLQGLYNVRKTIGDLMEGKAGTDKSAAKAATSELMQARQIIDDRMSAIAPSWPQYLQSFQQMSAPINRMQVGEELLRRANPSGMADTLGNPQIAPSSFSRSMTVLDRIAGKATGFKKAKAENILTPDDMRNLLAINDDVRRISLRQTNKAQPGSATSESAALRNKILQRSANMALPGPIGGFVNEFAQNQIRGANQATMEKIAYLAANPAEAQRVLSALKGRERSALESALIAIGGRTGVVGSTLTE